MSPRLLAVLALLVPMSCASPPAVAEESATHPQAAAALAAFSGAVDEVDAIVLDPETSPAAKRALVERVLARWLDHVFIARAALGPQAERFSPGELAEFTREVERFVMGRFVTRIAREKDEDFEIQGATWDERRKLATIRAVGGKPMVRGTFQRSRGRSGEVEYVLRKRRGEWRIVTLRIDGVDNVRVFRDEFASVLSRATPAELIEQLRERNARMEQQNPFEA